MDWVPINWGLVKNPLNWVIILLMILIAALALHVVTGAFLQTSQPQGV